MSTIIKVEDLSKQYRLGQIGTGTLSHDLNRWWHLLRGKEDPYLRLGEENDRTKRGASDYVWALKDVSFEVKKGEVLGIIGRNGAGKSTLLKILSRTTVPTLGSVKIKGRVASLLEVGTGFHPELSGRDNIYLNGSILGMKKREIECKFDEIVDFAGVEKYVDTPVKRYSSGMYVRLAFAVAAHLEPEILIVDEVLAVGDAEFQKKCLGKMKDVSANQGRTVLFVSHNMGAIKGLCKTGLLMDNGGVKSIGEIDAVISEYFKKGNTLEGYFLPEKIDKSEKVSVKQLTLRNQFDEITESFHVGDDIIAELTLEAEQDFDSSNIAIGIKSRFAFVTIANTMIDGIKGFSCRKGENKVAVRFKGIPLLPQKYFLAIGMRSGDGKTFLMQTKEIGYFIIKTRMSELGIEGSLAEEIAAESISPFIPYEWNFGSGGIKSFNILDNVKR